MSPEQKAAMQAGRARRAEHDRREREERRATWSAWCKRDAKRNARQRIAEEDDDEAALARIRQERRADSMPPLP